MQRPTRSQSAEILRKLDDGKPHSSGQLFPGLTAQQEAELTAHLLVLQEQGYVDIEALDKRGSHGVAHGAAGIRITQRGRDWLDRDQALSRFVANLRARRIQEVQARHTNRVREITNDHARRNMLQSGAYLAALARAGVDRTGELVSSQIDATMTAYEEAGIGLDETLLNELVAEAERHCAAGRASLRSSMDRQAKSTFTSPPAGMLDAINGEVDRGISKALADIRRELQLRYDRAILRRRASPAEQVEAKGGHDVFISHASEDKDDFVRPLAEALRGAGLSVWYDEFSLKLGDSLRRSIDAGLATSRFGVVVLSRHFFEKEWPQRELDGLVAKESAGVKVILPVWHEIGRDYVCKFSPTLADRVAADSAHGIPAVVEKIAEAMGASLSAPRPARPSQAKEPRLELMSGLFAEIRADLTGPDAELVREFFVLPHRGISLGGSSKPRFVYYEAEHKNLRGMLDVLEELGYVRDVTPAGNDTPIYRMTNTLVKHLLG